MDMFVNPRVLVDGAIGSAGHHGEDVSGIFGLAEHHGEGVFWHC